MRIKRIKLHNIRSHADTEIKLEKGINVFTGRTGSGKSSILLSIEYGLFGSEAGIKNDAILKRGRQSGYVELEFEEGGDIYTIRRGLKRKGKTIGLDIMNMGVWKNEKPISIVGRASDLNTIIYDILNYPKGVKAKEIFEITSYTKQDEIRSLIELSPEKRQEYIDKILQLSKYKTTWENMKDVISYFELNLRELKGKIENADIVKKEKEEIEKRVMSLREILKSINEELEKHRKDYLVINEETKKLESKRNELLEKRRSYDATKGAIERLKKENAILEKEIKKIEDEKNKILPKIKDTNLNYEGLKEKEINLKNLIQLNKKKIINTNEELSKLKKLGVGKCPVCRQPITKEHLENVEDEFQKLKDKIENEIESYENELNEISPKVKAALEAKELNDRYKLLDEKLKMQNDRLTKNNEEIIDLNSRITSFEFNSEKLDEIEDEYKSKKEVETELLSKIQTLSREHALRKEELQEKARELMSKENEIKDIEKSKEKVKRLDSAITLLSRMREDIRNIRNVVRRNFLEDFRQEFQKKFEEIRKYEEEYSVDIKDDYEPIAYDSNGEEVPIVSMSGGEKTSVALTYRLALADIAAQISDIKPSEMLILDEPTTGFDQEDVKALPEALRNIKTIPQIIIVTHEEELKNAADFKFEVSKEMGKSKIKEIT